jgi:hypothetical protein
MTVGLARSAGRRLEGLVAPDPDGLAQGVAVEAAPSVSQTTGSGGCSITKKLCRSPARVLRTAETPSIPGLAALTVGVAAAAVIATGNSDARSADHGIKRLSRDHEQVSADLRAGASDARGRGAGAAAPVDVHVVHAGRGRVGLRSAGV